MEYLLKLVPKTTLIVYVVKIVSFFRVNKRHFQTVVDLVMEAEKKFDNGADRSEWVKTQVGNLLRISAPYIVDIIVGLTVGWLGKGGFIHLKKMQ